MPRKKNMAVMWVQYLALRVVCAWAVLLGVGICLRLAAGVGRLIFRFDGRRRRRALDNLAIAFPQWTHKRRREVARRSVQAFAQLGVELLFLPRNVTRDNYEAHLIRHDPLGALPMFQARQPLIMAGGHFANWEAIGYFFSLEGHAIAGVARPIDNPLVNRWLLGIRESRGLRIIEKWDSAGKQVVEALGDRYAVGFIIDQNVAKGGLFVPFLGRLASTRKSAALLAVTMNVPVQCGYALRVEPYALKYKIAPTDIIRPQDWANKEDPIYYITARFMHAIENMVRDHPEQYLWMHRRWKTRPPFELKGQPMPESLKRKLRELDWMDEQAIERLGKPLDADPYA